MGKITWSVKKMLISDLTNWKDNPRTITEEGYTKLKTSIEELGNFEPLVINTDGTVIAGNQRLRLENERGTKEVEVNVPSRKLTNEEIKKIGLISNRHSGDWDMDKLANEFEETLKELGFNDLLPSYLEDVNKEIDTGSFENTNTLVFKLQSNDYMLALTLLANAVEKTESENNEECLMKLLKQYE